MQESIDSIYAQTFGDWEIIFIDNCSDDNSKEIVKKYDEKIKYYRLDENVELGEARNFGLSKCKGEYLAFLDTDDLWISDKLELQVGLLDKNREFQMCYGGVVFIDKNGLERGRILPVAQSGNVFGQLLKRYEINMQSVLLRNNQNIEFNKNKQFSPDFDLFMKIAAEQKVGVIKNILVKYRKLEDSLTTKKIGRWWIETKETLDLIFSKSPELIKKYQKEYDLAYAKVAYYKARYLIHIGNMAEARETLSKYKFVDKIYFILYILSCFPKTVWDFVHKYK